MIINRWTILGVSIFLFVEVLGFRVFPYEAGSMLSMQYVVAAVSLVSVLFFLGLFSFIYIFSAFQAAMNPYVNDVKDMDWLLNPVFFAWLFAKDKRQWCLYTTAISAPFGFIFGGILLFEGALNAINPLSLALGTCGGLGFMVIAALCWYKGICTPLTEAEDDEGTPATP